MVRSNRLPYWIWVGVCLLGYTFYFLLLVAMGIVMFPLGLAAMVYKPLQSLFQVLIHLTLKWIINGLLPFLGAFKIESFKNRECLLDPGAAIVICNHRSWLDTPVLISVFKGLIPVTKDLYVNNPFYRVFMRGAGFVRVNAEMLKSVKQAKEHSLEILSEGRKLLIFPEGSRSSTKKLLPFRRLAFQLAVETGVPVLPVLQSSNIPLMTKGLIKSYFPEKKVLLRIKVLEPIKPELQESVVAFTRRVEKIMNHELCEFDQHEAKNKVQTEEL